ncbi:MAG: hypothetical protein EXS16_15585 [Gemmataceae bacterium]|nr:hypothetical protein [Gemmataceae bacterium]
MGASQRDTKRPHATSWDSSWWRPSWCSCGKQVCVRCPIVVHTTYDPANPVVCMDEQPVQLIGETRVPIPATKEHPERVDYEYERKGTASIFMFTEPLSGFRQATARPRRTKYDWAHEVAYLLDTRYADNDRITLVCDNLNGHTKGAFYEAFPPEKACDYVRRIDLSTAVGSTSRNAS